MLLFLKGWFAMRALPCVFLAASALLCSAHIQGETVTYNVQFNATFTGPVNHSPSGNYQLTFDPTQSYTDTTTGLSINFFYDDLTAPAAQGFSYDPNGGVLMIGGLQNGVSNAAYGTNDYVLGIANFALNPTFAGFAAQSFSTPNSGYSTITGSVRVTRLSAVTPEPSTFALFGTGLLGIVAAVRRRGFIKHATA